jgi:histone acetyltransferase (RNA polymerase elongator complex component)
MIIPFFIPHSGCPHQCVFCNQKTITGVSAPETSADVPRKIEEYLQTRNPDEPADVAFYGGSFTALPLDVQHSYLEAVSPFISERRIRQIRISTRPDCITGKILESLKQYHVTIIELGAQSMDNAVLDRSGRGHRAEDTETAVRALREYAFSIGIQLMPGLPGDGRETFLNITVDKVISLMPDFVRLYPAVVVKGTALETLYRDGRYAPLTLAEAVALCRDAVLRFELAGIYVTRTGLQPTDELGRSGAILAGPYHPAFGQLVESQIFLESMRAALKGRKEKGDRAEFLVHPRNLSSALGQRRENVKMLMREYGLGKITVTGDAGISGMREIRLAET